MRLLSTLRRDPRSQRARPTRKFYLPHTPSQTPNTNRPYLAKLEQPPIILSPRNPPDTNVANQLRPQPRAHNSRRSLHEHRPRRVRRKKHPTASSISVTCRCNRPIPSHPIPSIKCLPTSHLPDHIFSNSVCVSSLERIAEQGTSSAVRVAATVLTR